MVTASPDTHHPLQYTLKTCPNSILFSIPSSFQSPKASADSGSRERSDPFQPPKQQKQGTLATTVTPATWFSILRHGSLSFHLVSELTAMRSVLVPKVVILILDRPARLGHHRGVHEERDLRPLCYLQEPESLHLRPYRQDIHCYRITQALRSHCQVIGQGHGLGAQCRLSLGQSGRSVLFQYREYFLALYDI